ncbi:MFS transporter [Streptomyces huiliensis]|uniref:MFS transporter n=1 Tax=Streptomyces huiliensis TaxID=2876027 RepID=UPI001CBF4939|nr:MFS transporter [Streptomyces huiliensis]MBZ4322814.1 MFS transporter [Streptomyces huiliensis]
MRLRLLLLALGAFAVGTDSMVMTGILDGIADDLGTSLAAAGQLVTVFGLAYALLAPVLATLTARWDRRRVLFTALAVFTVANALSALAPDYGTLLATRVLAAAGAALYTPTANAVATSLVPPERRGRAIATVYGGMTVATVLGVPLGAYLGHADWRWTMWLVTALGAAAFAGLAALLRDLPAPTGAPGIRERLAPLRDRRVLAAAFTTFLVFVAVNSTYVYLATAVRPATGGDQDRLSLILLATGLASMAGSWLGGRLVDRLGVQRVLLTGGVLAALAYAALPLLSGSMPGALCYAVVSPLAGWSIAVALPHRLVSLDPPNAPLLMSLNSSALYLGLAGAGVVGSTAIDVLGGRWFPVVSTVLMLCAVAMVLGTPRSRPLAVSAGEPAPRRRGSAAKPSNAGRAG